MLNEREWIGVDGATAEELACLQAVAPATLPKRYLDLLAFSNGGEGPLAVDPYNLCLDSAATVIETLKNSNHGQSDLRDFLIIGSNGAGEYIAFDLRHGLPWQIVTIDMVAGGSSAETIATDFNIFYDLIGFQQNGT